MDKRADALDETLLLYRKAAKGDAASQAELVRVGLGSRVPVKPNDTESVPRQPLPRLPEFGRRPEDTEGSDDYSDSDSSTHGAGERELEYLREELRLQKNKNREQAKKMKELEEGGCHSASEMGEDGEEVQIRVRVRV